MVLPLPPSKVQFLDANGNPLAGGFVYNYIPATTTLKTTWSDSAGTTTNANPVVLDSAGRAAIFGDGVYRQIVQDSLANQIYDANTSVASLSSLGAVAIAGDTMTGRLTVPGLTSTGGTPQTITPIGNPSLLAFNPTSMTTGSGAQNELGYSVNLTSNLGAGASSALSLNKVAGYFGIQANVGSGNVWAINPIVVVSAGACAVGGVQVAEFDLANNSGTNFGDTAGSAGAVQPAAFGMQVTGISTNRATAAIAVLGNLSDLVSPMWNRGLCFINNSISQVTIADYTNSATSIDLRGTHSGYGIDFQNGVFTTGAVRIGSQQKILARNAANSANLQVLQTSSSNNVVIGDNPTTPTSALNAYVLISSTTGLAPQNDNAQVCGQNGARWSAVWAANGTIQTSDPTLKTDIVPVAKRDTGGIVDAITPISFRWIDGGGGKPGKRQHWGWNAEEVGAVFEKHGEDFGGYVLADDGTRHMRPDQLLPVLWAEVQSLRARVAQLEEKG